jgi:hypothetical protein
MATGSMWKIDFRDGEVVVLRALREDHARFMAALAVGQSESAIIDVQERRAGTAICSTAKRRFRYARERCSPGKKSSSGSLFSSST